MLTDFKLGENYPSAEHMIKVIRSNSPELETRQIFDLYSEKKTHETSSDRQIIALF